MYQLYEDFSGSPFVINQSLAPTNISWLPPMAMSSTLHVQQTDTEPGDDDPLDANLPRDGLLDNVGASQVSWLPCGHWPTPLAAIANADQPRPYLTPLSSTLRRSHLRRLERGVCSLQIRWPVLLPNAWRAILHIDHLQWLSGRRREQLHHRLFQPLQLPAHEPGASDTGIYVQGLRRLHDSGWRCLGLQDDGRSIRVIQDSKFRGLRRHHVVYQLGADDAHVELFLCLHGLPR